MEEDRDFQERVWIEEVRLDEEWEDYVQEVGPEEAVAYTEYVCRCWLSLYIHAGD